MNKINLNFTKYFIIFSFTASVFFWSLEIFEFQVRFFYLISIFFFLKPSLKRISLYFILFILIHSLSTNYFYQIYDVNLLEILFLILLLFLIEKNYDFINHNIDYIIKCFSFIFVILLIIGLFFLPVSESFFDLPACMFGCFSIKNFIFKENSHYAITVLPIIFYLSLVKLNNLFLFIKYFLFFISLVNFSTTLFIGIISISLLFFLFDWKLSHSFQKKNFLKLIIFAILLFSLNSNEIKLRIIGLFNIESFKLYSIDKLHTSNKETNNNYNLNEKLPANLSLDVALKSFKISILSLKNYPLGVGMNNFSFSHKNLIKYIDTKYPITKDLNIQDGSNNFNKILTEFGIFSLIFAYLLIKFFFNKKIKIELKYLFFSFIFLQTFLRGVGYFNAGFLIIFLIILFNLYDIKKNND